MTDEPTICEQTGKVSHESFSKAREAIKRHKFCSKVRGQEFDNTLHVFTCKSCDGWHIGNGFLVNVKKPYKRNGRKKNVSTEIHRDN